MPMTRAMARKKPGGPPVDNQIEPQPILPLCKKPIRRPAVKPPAVDEIRAQTQPQARALAQRPFRASTKSYVSNNAKCTGNQPQNPDDGDAGEARKGLSSAAASITKRSSRVSPVKRRTKQDSSADPTKHAQIEIPTPASPLDNVQSFADDVDIDRGRDPSRRPQTYVMPQAIKKMETPTRQARIAARKDIASAVDETYLSCCQDVDTSLDELCDPNTTFPGSILTSTTVAMMHRTVDRTATLDAPMRTFIDRSPTRSAQPQSPQRPRSMGRSNTHYSFHPLPGHRGTSMSTPYRWPVRAEAQDDAPSPQYALPTESAVYSRQSLGRTHSSPGRLRISHMNKAMTARERLNQVFSSSADEDDSENESSAEEECEERLPDDERVVVDVTGPRNIVPLMAEVLQSPAPDNPASPVSQPVIVETKPLPSPHCAHEVSVTESSPVIDTSVRPNMSRKDSATSCSFPILPINESKAPVQSIAMSSPFKPSSLIEGTPVRRSSALEQDLPNSVAQSDDRPNLDAPLDFKIDIPQGPRYAQPTFAFDARRKSMPSTATTPVCLARPHTAHGFGRQKERELPEVVSSPLLGRQMSSSARPVVNSAQSEQSFVRLAMPTQDRKSLSLRLACTKALARTFSKTPQNSPYKTPIRMAAATPNDVLLTPYPTQPLRSVVALVKIFTLNGSDASRSFIASLRRLGASIIHTWSDTVTHVVFKDGSPNTLRKIRIRNTEVEGSKLGSKVYCVNSRWVTDCDRLGKKMNETSREYVVDIADAPKRGHRRRESMASAQLAAITRHACKSTPDRASIMVNGRPSPGRSSNLSTVWADTPSKADLVNTHDDLSAKDSSAASWSVGTTPTTRCTIDEIGIPRSVPAKHRGGLINVFDRAPARRMTDWRV